MWIIIQGIQMVKLKKKTGKSNVFVLYKAFYKSFDFID